MPTPVPHSSPSVRFTMTLLLFAIFVVFATTTNAQTVLKNGDIFQNIKYTYETTFDANTKLKDETAYSSSIIWKSCTLSNTVTINGTFDTERTFATSLYFTIEKATFNSVGQYDFYNLPPNSYVHAIGTKGSVVKGTLFNMRPTTETNNITAFIDDSTVTYDASTSKIFVALSVPPGSPFIVTHMRNAKLTNAYDIFSTTTCSDGSTIFLEKITCISCRYDLIRLDSISTVTRQSALILKDITIIGHVYPERDGLLRTGAAVEIDATSVLAVVDVDLTNNFRAGTPLRLFYSTKINGTGAIVLLRIQMGSSGLGTIEPADNTNFWVVAKRTASREMTTTELREAKFNVNTNNVIHWDGRGNNGKCVQAGLALPNTATYELVGSKCESTCPQGNFLQPACTPRALCTGVPNCQACYAHPKEMCLQCVPHADLLDNSRRCKCHIRECMECPEATLCTKCTADYIFSPDNNSCYHCVIDKCTLCKDDDQCSGCEDGYKVYNNACIHCDIEHCETCTEPGHCVECAPQYNPSYDGTKCIQCFIPGCQECSDEGVCAFCKEGYTFVPSDTPTENKCVRCGVDVDKCATCKEDGVCLECIADHTPVNEGANCFHCTVTGCDGCSADGVCSSCKDGYSLVESPSRPTDNKCVACDIPKCETCRSDGICSECITDHKPGNGGTACFHCTIPGCQECSADGVCGSCEDGYTFVSSATPTENKCVRCAVDVDKCATCKEDGVCLECIAGHTPANEGANCFHCTVTGCDGCAADGVCSSCKDGYSLVESPSRPTDNKCVRCGIDIPKCHTCEEEGICSVCEDGGYQLSTDALRCTMCTVDGCQRCDIAEVCALCSPGMTTNEDGQCTACDIGNCTYCSASNICALCTCGLIPSDDGESCVHCSAGNCKHCDPASGGKKCAECQDGYEVSSAGACIKSGLPQWVVFLIVVAVSILLMAAVVVGYNLYMRRQRRLAQMAADAEERRKNRMCKGRGARHYTEIAVLDLGDIEDAASGVRDNIKTNRV